MKIIFLDIDGVLNTYKTIYEVKKAYKQNGIESVEIDETKVILLKQIVDQTGALLVLSSSWRFLGCMINGVFVPAHPKVALLINILSKYGLSIYDVTKRDVYGIRQNEIREWIYRHDVTDFVILDDEKLDLADYENGGLILTKFYNFNDNNDLGCGLCEEHVREAINRLNKKVLTK